MPHCNLRTADLYKEMRAREILQGIEPDPNLEKLWVAVATQKKQNPLVEARRGLWCIPTSTRLA